MLLLIARYLFLPPPALQLGQYGAQFLPERPADIWITFFNYFAYRRTSSVAVSVPLQCRTLLFVEAR